MARNSGIFVHTSEKDIEVIIKSCKKMLKSFDDNSAIIVGVNYNEDYCGFKVFFSDASVVHSFLKREHMVYIESPSSIHPLTTKLTVHTVHCDFPDDEERFKKSIKDKLEKKFSRPILNISFVPVSSSYPDIPCGDWLVELDVPEIETLNVFRRSGLPDYMRLWLRAQSNQPSEEIRVSLNCSICNNLNHSRRKCPSFTRNSITIIDLSEDNADLNCLPESPCFNTQITDSNIDEKPSVDDLDSKLSCSSSPLKSNDVILRNTSQNIKRNNVESDVMNKDNGFSNQNFHMQHKVIKNETNDESSSLMSPKNYLIRTLNENDSENCRKKFRSSPIDKNLCSSEINSDLASVNASSSQKEPAVCRSEFENGLQDYSNLFNETTSESEFSSQMNCDPSRLNFDDSNPDEYFGESNNTAHNSPSTTKVFTPFKLPFKFRQIVISKELKEGELDIEKLEAFFNHARKKVNIGYIAKQYTTNIQRLVTQLEWIKKQYYLSDPGDKEHYNFVKWLEGLLRRFP